MQVDRLSFWAACAICIACGASLAHAQGPGGPPGGGFGGRGGFNPDDFFNRLDRNGNGQLDPDELQNSPMRRMFEAGGRDLSKPISKQEFTEMSNQAMQRFRGMGRGGGPAGAGGPPGAPPTDGAAPPTTPPAGNPEADGGRRGRGRRGDRGEREDRQANENDSKGATPPAGGAGGGPTGPAKPNSKGGGSSASRPRARLTVDLPEQYASRDTNQDGQLGLYEWPKTDWATFKRLDLNGDGFVTPQELERSNRRSTTPGATAASAGTGAGGATSPPAGSPVAAAKPGTGEANPRQEPKPAERPAANAAETAFNLLDRDKDGAISEEEWQRSLTTKSRFERAGLTVTFPFSKADFVRQYPAEPR
jgi:Ca2+-binding EF-hand superfamily protein